jgi:hypothetical protein
MSPAPVLQSAAADLYDRLTPIAKPDAGLGYPLANYMAALGTMLQVIDDYARDQNVSGKLAPGWSQLLDVNRCPPECLPWLGQFVGVPVNVALNDAQQRTQVRSRNGWQRGTLGAIVAAAQSQLNGNYGDAVLRYNPDVYWRLNDAVGATSVYDTSGNGMSGTPVGTMTFGTTGLLPNDPDKAVAIGAGSGDITSLYAAYAPDSLRTYQGIAVRSLTTKEDDLFSDTSGNVLMYCQSGGENVAFRTISGNAQVWAAAWPGTAVSVWWALTYNDNTHIAELFINGVSQGTKTLSTGFVAPGGDFVLGASGANGWQGTLDEVSVYNGILTAAQIQAIYNARNIPPTARGVTVVERDSNACAPWPPYGLSVFTRSSQTPSSANVLAALMAQKPAGIILNYQVLADATYADLYSTYSAYSGIYGAFHTYGGAYTNTPGT